jgi:hypothetical protein
VRQPGTPCAPSWTCCARRSAGIQAAILKDLQAASYMVVERKAEVDMEQRWENRYMPFVRPVVIALISALLTLIVIHGQEILKGWAGKGP